MADCRVRQAAPEQAPLAGRVDPLRGRPRRHHHRTRFKTLTTSCDYGEASVRWLDLHDAVRAVSEAEIFQLAFELLHHISPGDDFMPLEALELQVIVRLTAQVLTDQEGFDAFVQRIDRSGQPCRAAADDD